jgi:methylenetetrahydrofolate--tRNA-(uracil-5-)-methyltransferase
MAGSEAAWQAANQGISVVIHEMRPKVGTFAHQTGNLGEMVCSNSFRSDDNEQNAVGLLHWEMRQANGLIMSIAEKHRIPAGGALAVDREPFAESVTAALKAHPNISVSYDEITELPDDGHWIVATGPLTSDALSASIAKATGAEHWPFSTQSPQSSILTRSTCPKRGCSRAMTRAKPKKSAPRTLTARWIKPSTRPSSMR